MGDAYPLLGQLPGLLILGNRKELSAIATLTFHSHAISTLEFLSSSSTRRS